MYATEALSDCVAGHRGASAPLSLSLSTLSTLSTPSTLSTLSSSSWAKLFFPGAARIFPARVTTPKSFRLMNTAQVSSDLTAIELPESPKRKITSDSTAAELIGTQNELSGDAK